MGPAACEAEKVASTPQGNAARTGPCRSATGQHERRGRQGRHSCKGTWAAPGRGGGRRGRGRGGRGAGGAVRAAAPPPPPVPGGNCGRTGGDGAPVLPQFGGYKASVSRSPVRMRTIWSTVVTQILPSPILSVRAAATM